MRKKIMSDYKICVVIDNVNELQLFSKVKEMIKDNIDIQIIDNTRLDVSESDVLKSLDNKRIELIQISIYSPLYKLFNHISLKSQTPLLVKCFDFSSNYAFPSAVKKSSTILSYTYYQTRLTFVDRLLVDSFVAKKRIEDMGIDKAVYILNPCFDYFSTSNLNKDVDFKIPSQNKKIILIETSLFNGEEIISFIEEIKKHEEYYPCFLIDSSSSDFASLYQLDLKYVYSSKDYNRLLIYKASSYLYSRKDKLDDYDLQLACYLNIPVISSLSDENLKNNEYINYILDENKKYIESRYTLEKYTQELKNIYESIRRKNY